MADTWATAFARQMLGLDAKSPTYHNWYTCHSKPYLTSSGCRRLEMGVVKLIGYYNILALSERLDGAILDKAMRYVVVAFRYSNTSVRDLQCRLTEYRQLALYGLDSEENEAVIEALVKNLENGPAEG